MSHQPLSFIHHFEPGTVGAPLLLLHGTGGDVTDLLPLGRAVAPGAALLSPRGQVSEHGMARFFRRLAEGVFDEADVRRRAEDLADFVEAARAEYGLEAPIALGFSNGANIAAATLLLRPEAFAAAVLLRPMVPLSRAPQVDLARKPVLIVSGATDPIVSAADAACLARLFEESGAEVDHKILPASHGLSHHDVTTVKSWIERHAVQNGADAA